MHTFTTPLNIEKNPLTQSHGPSFSITFFFSPFFFQFQQEGYNSPSLYGVSRYTSIVSRRGFSSGTVAVVAVDGEETVAKRLPTFFAKLRQRNLAKRKFGLKKTPRNGWYFAYLLSAGYQQVAGALICDGFDQIPNFVIELKKDHWL